LMHRQRLIGLDSRAGRAAAGIAGAAGASNRLNCIRFDPFSNTALAFRVVQIRRELAILAIGLHHKGLILENGRPNIGAILAGGADTPPDLYRVRPPFERFPVVAAVLTRHRSRPGRRPVPGAASPPRRGSQAAPSTCPRPPAPSRRRPSRPAHRPSPAGCRTAGRWTR
jgi:hypothetical protein